MLLFWLARNRAAEDQALERLASGKRINRGSDDPAGLVSATQLDAAIRALDAEVKITSRLDANANIADASLSQLSDLTSELNAAVVRAANTAGLSPDEQAAAQFEVDQLVQSIGRFSDQSVESLGGVGLDDEQRQALSEHLRNATSGLASLTSGGENHLGSGNFEAAQGIVREAMNAFSTARGTVGAFQKSTLPRALRRPPVRSSRSQRPAAGSSTRTSRPRRRTWCAPAHWRRPTSICCAFIAATPRRCCRCCADPGAVHATAGQFAR